jgi:catechol O-methyltransferase
VSCPDSHIYSFDIDPDMHSLAKSLIDHSGLSNRITLISSTIQESEISEKIKGTADLLFLDHEKDLYEVDLDWCMDNGLLKSGSVVLADNIRYPGAPGYVKWYDRISLNQGWKRGVTGGVTIMESKLNEIILTKVGERTC